jgi:hypothetical protein
MSWLFQSGDRVWLSEEGRVGRRIVYRFGTVTEIGLRRFSPYGLGYLPLRRSRSLGRPPQRRVAPCLDAPTHHQPRRDRGARSPVGSTGEGSAVRGVVMSEPTPASGESDWPDVDVRLGYDAPPLLPPGDYTARLRCIKKRFSHGSQPRLFFDFAIVEGDHAGAVIQFICTLPGQPKGSQRFGRVAPSSRFFRAWVIAQGGQRPSRHDRMSLDVFRHRLFRIRVRTVEEGSNRPAAPSRQSVLRGRHARGASRVMRMRTHSLPAPFPYPIPSPSPTPTQPKEKSATEPTLARRRWPF